METKRKSMYELLQDYNEIMTEIESLDGELTDESSVLLDINKDEAESKLAGYKNFIKFLKTSANNNKDEKKKYDAKNKSIMTRIKSLNNVVLTALHAFGEIGKTGNFKFTGATYTLYSKITKKLVIEKDYSNSNYEDTMYSIGVPHNVTIKDSDTINDLILNNNVKVIINKVVNETLLKAHLLTGVYKCDDEECPAHKSHLLEECECLNVPYISYVETPIFR